MAATIAPAASPKIGKLPPMAPSPGTSGAAAAAMRWEALFDCPAPPRLPSLVAQAVAWREQVLAHGDISAAVAHDLRLAAEHALQQRGIHVAGASRPAVDDSHGVGAFERVPVSTVMAAPAALPKPVAASPVAKAVPRRQRVEPLPPAASQLLPGSQLIKAYGGRNHVVAVEEDGFRYEGERFASLSALARHITGTHWNGLLFFGLRKRRTYPPKPRRHG